MKDGIENLGDNLRKIHLDKVAKSGYKPQSLDEVIAEGNALLKLDAKKSKKDFEKAFTPSTAKNPYIKAREEVLASMPVEIRKAILQLEKTNKEHHSYKDFVKSVMKLGDQFSA